jgi:DNA mismatch repair protein MutS
MGFIADRQTLEDLNLLDRYGNDAVFSLFNQVKTKGGGLLLEKMFRHPLADPKEINQRSNIFKYFSDLSLEFPLDSQLFSVMDEFLNGLEAQNRIFSLASVLRRKALQTIGLHEEYDFFIQGLRVTSGILHRLDVFLDNLLKAHPETPIKDQIISFRSVYRDKRFRKLYASENGDGISVGLQWQCSHILGNLFRESMLEMLGLLYKLDVYIAIGRVARVNKFAYATATPAGGQTLQIMNCRYPALKNAKGNDIRLDRSTNVLFITGANMAGKSTLMKSIGVAVYLAHIGFPVAADQMQFSVKQGIFSSINLPDDISQGLSHFYAEVLRVKAVAEEVSASKDLLVIFDELFKGTNVKDAFDATLAVTQAFAEYRNCSFVISTHILEVTDSLAQTHRNIQFSYMPTIMKGKSPTYTYELTEGVSADRHGMMIIENEGILAMLGD